MLRTVYHKNGIIYINHDGFNLTISNENEFLQIIEKIKNYNYDNDEKVSFVKKMIFIDLVNSAKKEQSIFQDKICLRNYP
jgi:hypothetical protein